MALNDTDNGGSGGGGGGGGHHRHAWHGDGLRIRLLHERGETDKHALKKDFHFQCPPLETITMQYGATHTDYTVVKAGEFSRQGGKNLTIISFSSLFVEWGEFVVRTHQWDPQKQIGKLKKLVSTMTPFRLQIGEFLPKHHEVNMLATLRDFQVEMRAGEPDTRYYNVEFHQYRPVEVRRKKKGHNHHKHHGGKGSDGTPRSHRLQDADTLAVLARRYYGKPTAAKQIAAANRSLQNWGNNTPIVQNPRYTRHDLIQIPSIVVLDRVTRIKPKVTQDELLEARDDANAELHITEDDN